MDAFLGKVLTSELSFLTADSKMQRERNDLRQTCSEMKQSSRIKNLNRESSVHPYSKNCHVKEVVRRPLDEGD